MEKIIHFLASKGRLRVLIEMQSRINLLNRVNCGDVMDLMSHIPSNSIHLAITSPPYNVGIEYDKHDDQMKYEQYLIYI